MKTAFLLLPAVLILCVSVPACSPNRSSPPPSTPSAKEKTEVTILPNGEPSEITVQHCLISFDGALPGQTVRRNKEEAEKLANDLLKLVESGDNFDEIIRQFTDDSAPGIYSMSNTGQKGDAMRGVVPREQMVAAFGDVGFKLDVGQYGLAVYDPQKSKFGWHIIKRIK